MHLQRLKILHVFVGIWSVICGRTFILQITGMAHLHGINVIDVSPHLTQITAGPYETRVNRVERSKVNSYLTFKGAIKH